MSHNLISYIYKIIRSINNWLKFRILTVVSLILITESFCQQLIYFVSISVF